MTLHTILDDLSVACEAPDLAGHQAAIAAAHVELLREFARRIEALERLAHGHDLRLQGQPAAAYLGLDPEPEPQPAELRFWRQGAPFPALIPDHIRQAFRLAHAYAVVEIECNCWAATRVPARPDKRYVPVDENRQPVATLAEADPDLRRLIDWAIRHGLAHLEQSEHGTVIALDYTPEDLE